LGEERCVDQKWFGDVSLVGEVLMSNLDRFFYACNTSNSCDTN
jgi:hypothetical protein